MLDNGFGDYEYHACCERPKVSLPTEFVTIETLVFISVCNA